MALLPDLVALPFSDDDREFNEHRDKLQRIVLNHAGSKRALYDEVLIILHTIWYQRCLEKRQYTQREKTQKLKNRAGCCYRLLCAPCCCCLQFPMCYALCKYLLGFWIVLGFALLVYATFLRLFY